jgi:hypothetical protein
VEFEFYIKVHSNAGTGVLRLWENGVLIAERNEKTISSSGNSINEIRIAGYWNDPGVPQTQDFWMDNVVVYNSAAGDIPGNFDAAGNRYIGTGTPGGGGGTEVFAEAFSSAPLVSPWYDETGIQVAAMPADSDSAVLYEWDANSDELPDTPNQIGTARRQFSAMSDLDFTFTCQLIDFVQSAHIWYFRTTEDAQYESPTAGFSLYLEADSSGAAFVDLRRSNNTWSNYTSTGNNLYDGNKHTVRMVATANDVGFSNGGLKVWVDGVLEIDNNNVEYFTVAGQQFNQIMLGPYVTIPNNNPNPSSMYIGNCVLSTV